MPAPATKARSIGRMHSSYVKPRPLSSRQGLDAVRLIGHEPPEHLVAEPAPESPDRLGLRVTGGHALGEVLLAGAGSLQLGDRDPVEGDVELAVTAAVEPMADGVA